MTTKPTPAKKPIRMQYVEREVPEDEALEIHDFPGRPEVQVLAVDQREGPVHTDESGLVTPVWINIWKLCLIWR